MGVHHIVLPLNEAIVGLLRSHDLAVAPPAVPSRSPTSDGVRAALGSLSNCDIEYTLNGESDFDARVSARWDNAWTVLHVRPHTDGPGSVTMTFEKGWVDLIVRIVSSVSRSTGPLVIMPDTGDRPMIVGPDGPVT